MVLLSILAACSGCGSCVDLPNAFSDDDVAQDSGGDSGNEDGDSAAPPDTGPPAKCTFEVFDDADFENDFFEPVPIPTQSWVCSTFDAGLDFEVLEFETQGGGWLSVDVQAASRGSSADVYLTINPANDEGEVCGKYSALSTTDPRLVWLSKSQDVWHATIYEEERGYGPEYSWWVLAASVKSPVSYTRTEDEVPHTTVKEAVTLAEGETVLAWLSAYGGNDWWRIELPVDEFGNRHNRVMMNTDAAQFGSGANTVVELYKVRGDGGCEVLTAGDGCGPAISEGLYPGVCTETAVGLECLDYMWKDDGGDEVWNTDSWTDTALVPAYDFSAGEPVAMYFDVFDQGTPDGLAGCADQFLWYTLSFTTSYDETVGAE